MKLFTSGLIKNIIDLNDRCIYNIAIMKKLFVKYVSQNILGMVGMSLYILADTFFISKAVGSNGITALNLVLPVYNLIFAIGAMIGVGSAIRYVVEKNKGDTSSESYFFSCPAVVYYNKRYIHIDWYFHPGQARRAARRRFGNYKYR